MNTLRNPGRMITVFYVFMHIFLFLGHGGKAQADDLPIDSFASMPDDYELNVMDMKFEICDVAHEDVVHFEGSTTDLTRDGVGQLEYLMRIHTFAILPQKLFIGDTVPLPEKIPRYEVIDRRRADAIEQKLLSLGLSSDVVVGLHHECESADQKYRRAVLHVRRPKAEQVIEVY